MTFNPTDITFEEPTRHQILPLGRSYYTQALKCSGNDLIIASDWFSSSHGISYSHMDHKPEIRVMNCQAIVKILHTIEDVAVKQLKLPAEFNHSGSNEPVFKRLPSAYNLFFKLSSDCVFFDENKSITKPVDWGFGNYRVVFKIVGLYIGPHGMTEKLASLQVRIIQVQYEQTTPPCYFDMMVPIPKPQLSLFQNNNCPKPPAEVKLPLLDESTQTKVAVSKKKGRPKLARLNSVMDTRLQQSKESNPAEVDTDVDMDSTQP